VEVVFADVDGAIGSQVAARVPVRHDGDGQLPTAGWRGEGRWDGWRARDTLPRAATPPAGYVASANHNRAREARLRDVLTTADGLTVEDTRRLQQDVLAWNAERLVPLFASLRAPRDDVDLARQRLLAWNRRVSTDSTEASLYVAWEGYARRMLVERRVPSDLVEEFVTRAGDAFVPAMTAPASDWFDGDVRRTRNALMLRALTTAVDALKARAGDVERGPAWGQLHAATFAHPLAVTDAARRRFTVGPFPRPGYADTLLSTSGRGFEAAVGASFSAVFDLSRWDASIAENAPGQSEYPASAHFADLARLWSTGQSFPLVFSDAAVRANAETTLTLVPR
jgi:penicillin amidase